jgi:hypothetical protein
MYLTQSVGANVVTLALSQFTWHQHVVLLETRCLVMSPATMKSDSTTANRLLLGELWHQVSLKHIPTLAVLGANTKAVELNDGGQLLQRKISAADIPIHHGNTLTTKWCLVHLMMYLPILRYKYGQDMNVVVIGASSSIGRQLVAYLLDQMYRVSFVTSDRSRYDAFEHAHKDQLMTFVNSGDAQQLHTALRASPACLLGVMVDNSMWYHDDVTIFNFTAVEYDTHPLYHRHRVVEMALCTLSNGSPLQFNGRYHHMLETGRFHMCMMSGVLTSLQMDVGCTADHEPPLDSMNSFSEALAIQWLTHHRAEYGLATMKPSKPFSTGSQTHALGCLQLWTHCCDWGLPAELETRTLDGFCRYSTDQPPQPDLLEWVYDCDQFTICGPRAVD